VSDLK